MPYLSDSAHMGISDRKCTEELQRSFQGSNESHCTYDEKKQCLRLIHGL